MVLPAEGRSIWKNKDLKKLYYLLSVFGCSLICFVLYVLDLDNKTRITAITGLRKTTSMRNFSDDYFERINASEVNRTLGDAPVYDYNVCLFLKSVSNQRQGLSSPKELAKYNCTRLMTLSGAPIGRLGNMMFQIASLIGIANWHGYTPVFRTEWTSLIKYFELPNKIDFKLSSGSRGVGERVCCEHSQNFYHLNHSYNWTLDGFRQSWKYLEGAEDRIRETFTFKKDLKLNVTIYLKSITKKGVKNVGVHMRLGDFNSSKIVKLGYTVAPASYIERAMHFFRYSLKTVQFILVSNDIDLCKKTFNDTDIYFSPFTDPGEDMALMSSCDHMIISSGSFGWWGAWLADGITVYYAGYPRPGSWLETQFGKTDNGTGLSDYYPKHWIGLR